jgi:hypothetical protein
MEKLDRRKFPRVKIFNPISYDCVDKEGIRLDQNMGIALDISQNGILLETAKKIESKNIFLLFVSGDIFRKEKRWKIQDRHQFRRKLRPKHAVCKKDNPGLPLL